MVKILLGMVLAALALGPGPGHAADDPALERIDSVPPPPPLRSGEVLEPEINIVQDRRGRVREHRIGGRLVAIEVIPRDAPPYYLVDTDGDGDLDALRHELSSDILVNSWLLFTWK